MSKPSIPKGTRDFSTAEMSRREMIFDTIRDVFRLYGYQPIETPAMENLSTLLGKYGEEGDKLLFRILNSGDFLSEVNPADLAEKNLSRLSSQICEKGLRYDLTVPFARYVVQHRDEITFPFRRYQIQPVWRADRPQKGRYREFYQCDVDVIGSDSLLNEYELVRIIDDIFGKLKIRTVIVLNNRKILSGIAEYIGEASRITDITVAIDKLEKTSLGEVNAELISKGISNEAVQKLQPLILLAGSTDEKLEKLSKILAGSETGLAGISEMKELLAYLELSHQSSGIEFDLTLARGLNYYTGAIIEVKAKDVSIGSICGGGRYDNLTGVFGLKGISGVGVSFGADRIYDVMLQLGLFEGQGSSSAGVLLLNFGKDSTAFNLNLLGGLRKAGIRSELYPDHSKIARQLSYANIKKIPFVVMAGPDEMAKGLFTLKNMNSGEQLSFAADKADECIEYIKEKWNSADR
jgi:histidyl-tRNA synthetase